MGSGTQMLHVRAAGHKPLLSEECKFSSPHLSLWNQSGTFFSSLHLYLEILAGLAALLISKQVWALVWAGKPRCPESEQGFRMCSPSPVQ